MSDQDRIVDGASDESFPASDPPAWTPVTGAGDHHLRPAHQDGDVRPVGAGHLRADFFAGLTLPVGLLRPPAPPGTRRPTA